MEGFNRLLVSFLSPAWIFSFRGGGRRKVACKGFRSSKSPSCMYYYLLGVIAGLERREGPPCGWRDSGARQMGKMPSRFGRSRGQVEKNGGRRKHTGKVGAARSRYAWQASAWARSLRRRGAGGRADSEYEYSITSYTSPALELKKRPPYLEVKRCHQSMFAAVFDRSS